MATSPKIPVLSQEDINLLKLLIAKSKNQIGNTSNRPLVDWDEAQTPEVYVAFTPSLGISRLIGITPGVAECDIYKLSDNNLVETGFSKDVYNLSTESVPSSSFILTERDKFGTWFAVGSAGTTGVDGTGTGTGVTHTSTCYLASLHTTDCILATCSNGQEVTLIWNHTISKWTSGGGPGTGVASGDILTYPGGSGFVEFWYATGRLHLSISGIELIDCGNGCFSGGQITGHTAVGTGTTPVQPCTSTHFQVCLTCHQCPPKPITNVCCPGKVYPATLYATLSPPDGPCACLGFGTVIPLVWSESNGDWRYEGSLCDFGTSPAPHTIIRLKCNSDTTFQLQGIKGCVFSPVNPSLGINCTPLNLTYTVPAFGCCADAVGVHVTE